MTMTMTSRKHFLISLLVSVFVAILFVFFTKDLHVFELNEKFQLVPEGFGIPRGCDVKMDMQTGQIWAKLSVVPKSKSNEFSLISIPETETEPEGKGNAKGKGNGAPEYQNLTKSRIQSRYSHGSAERIELALKEIKTENSESWQILEEESPAMEVGLGILESNNFVRLRIKIADGNERALNILSMCLQNNPLAVERANEINLFENEIFNLLSRNDLNLKVYQKLLKIIESFSKYDESEFGKKILVNIKVEITKQNLIHEKNLNERSLEILKELL